MTNSFGYLNKLGYAGHQFPIVIGETGSFYTSAQVRCLHLLFGALAGNISAVVSTITNWKA